MFLYDGRNIVVTEPKIIVSIRLLGILHLRLHEEDIPRKADRCSLRRRFRRCGRRGRRRCCRKRRGRRCGGHVRLAGWHGRNREGRRHILRACCNAEHGNQGAKRKSAAFQQHILTTLSTPFKSRSTSEAFPNMLHTAPACPAPTSSSNVPPGLRCFA